MPDLKPCPFCGSNNIKFTKKPHESFKELDDPIVYCPNCFAQIRLTPDCTEKDLTAYWNNRVEDNLKERIKALTEERDFVKKQLTENTMQGTAALKELEEAKDDKEVFRDALEFIINHVPIQDNGFYRQAMKEN